VPDQPEKETPLWLKMLQSASIVAANAVVFVIVFISMHAFFTLFN
jgi:hypothetical protein